MNKYILKYERLKEKCCDDKSTNRKKEAWTNIISDIENGLANGNGYELSFVRDAMKKQLQVDNVTNREVKILLTHHFTDQICFSQPKQLNKSELFFSKGVSTENMADKIRVTDPIKECAAIIRQCLLEVDFDLQDRFCDATDLKTSWNAVPIPEPIPCTTLTQLNSLQVYKYQMLKMISPKMNRLVFLSQNIDICNASSK